MDEVEIVPDAENFFHVAIGGTGEVPIWRVALPDEAIEGIDITVDQFNEILRNCCVYYPDHEIGLPLLNALAMVSRPEIRRWMGYGVDDDVRRRALGEEGE